MRVSPPGIHFIAESTEAMRMKCLAEGHNMLMLGFVPSTSVSRSHHPNHITIMLIVSMQVKMGLLVLDLKA